MKAGQSRFRSRCCVRVAMAEPVPQKNDKGIREVNGIVVAARRLYGFRAKARRTTACSGRRFAPPLMLSVARSRFAAALWGRSCQWLLPAIRVDDGLRHMAPASPPPSRLRPGTVVHSLDAMPTITRSAQSRPTGRPEGTRYAAGV
jgi:hypothetical protein